MHALQRRRQGPPALSSLLLLGLTVLAVPVAPAPVAAAPREAGPAARRGGNDSPAAWPGRPARASARAEPAIPGDTSGLFPRPTGPYAVGMRDQLWVDSTRDDPYTSDWRDHRHLMVRIWYPVAPGTKGDTAHYVLHPEEFPANPDVAAGTGFVTNALLDAPLAADGGPFPLLIYNPGGGNPRMTGTFMAEELASHGYIVVCAGHPGFGGATAFPDGYVFKNDALPEPPAQSDLERGALAFFSYLDWAVFPIWVADSRFVLDRMEGLARTPGSPFAGRVDTTRIGALGWSFGGATSVQLTRVDPRVKAAADLDGQLFGDVRAWGTDRPILFLHHVEPPSKDPEMTALVALVQGWGRAARARVRAPWYNVSFKGTTHGDFSDWVLWIPKAAGPMGGTRAHQLIRAYTLAFFDKELEGKAEPLLDGNPERGSDVVFARHAGVERER